MERLLAASRADRDLAVSGCVANQRRSRDRFDAVVLPTAPIEVMLDRVVSCTTEDYGKTSEQRAEIRANREIQRIAGWLGGYREGIERSDRGGRQGARAFNLSPTTNQSSCNGL